jgi:DHA1 family bicyclomycin/chloramphenicol resistance-like MFS transporter
MFMTVTDGTRTVKRGEFIGILAMTMSVAALAIDLMLPALSDIREEFGLASDSTAVAGLVTTFMLGLALAQIGYGVLSDRVGRKPMIFLGLALYAVGAIGSAVAPNLGWLLGARFIWGLGAAGPRVITISVIRDTYVGDQMARAMSFIMAIFILVPVVAPSLGAFLTDWITWRGAFGFCVVVAVLVALLVLRLPETLHPENRIRLTWRDVAAAGRKVVTTRVTIGYTFAITAMFGVFFSYLASSELIFDEVFGLDDEFPVIFGGIAVIMGLAMYTNGRIVIRVGLSRLVRIAMMGYVGVTAVLASLAWLTDGQPGFWIFALVLAASLVMHALLVPNMNSMAMVPMGQIAGTASAVIGTVSTAVGALVGSFIDRAYDGSVMPLSVAFLVTALVALGISRWAGAPAKEPMTIEPQPVYPVD